MSKVVSIANIIESVFEDAGLSKAVNLLKINNAFDEIFDGDFRKNIRVLSLMNSILYIGVPGSVWIQELSFMKEDIISKLNTKLGQNSIKDIKFREV